MKKLGVIWACVLLVYKTASAGYDGNNLLVILGQSTASPNYKEFKSFWALDKDGQNPAMGIKVYINAISDKVESIIIASDNTDLGGTRYKKCTARLPNNISLDDDTARLVKKLGRAEKLLGRNTLKFYSHNSAIEVSYSDLKTGKITFIKFSADPTHHSSSTISTSPANNNETVNNKQPEKSRVVTTSAQSNPKSKEIPMTPFKRAILDVFKASKESSFDNIKADARTEGNFWKYKYTYNTKLKIPGEKYNMIYSFPFVTSQLDFVVVLKESDSFEKSLEDIYHDFEKKLTDNFPASEGWISSCLPGKDKSQLPDLEFRNDKYGAVILDHSQNPAGRHILYLRFLLFSD